MEDIYIVYDVLRNANEVFENCKNKIDWNKSMKSRFTANFGAVYTYSNEEVTTSIPSYLKGVVNVVNRVVGYTNNNVLVNYYYEGGSKMGFHSDDVSQLEDETGVLILSLGDTRTMQFKNKEDKSITFDISLRHNSLVYMSKQLQNDWLHAVLPSIDESNQRMSITFRNLKKP